jgi:hypothetical protein
VLSTKVGWAIVERPGGDTGIFADAPPSDVVLTTASTASAARSKAVWSAWGSTR